MMKLRWFAVAASVAAALGAAPHAGADGKDLCIVVQANAGICLDSPIPDPLLPPLPELPAEQGLDLSSLVSLADGI